MWCHDHASAQDLNLGAVGLRQQVEGELRGPGLVVPPQHVERRLGRPVARPGRLRCRLGRRDGRSALRCRLGRERGLGHPGSPPQRTILLLPAESPQPRHRTVAPPVRRPARPAAPGQRALINTIGPMSGSPIGQDTPTSARIESITMSEASTVGFVAVTEPPCRRWAVTPPGRNRPPTVGSFGGGAGQWRAGLRSPRPGRGDETGPGGGREGQRRATPVLAVPHPDHLRQIRRHLHTGRATVVATGRLAPDSAAQLHDFANSRMSSRDALRGSASPRRLSHLR